MHSSVLRNKAYLNAIAIEEIPCMLSSNVHLLESNFFKNNVKRPTTEDHGKRSRAAHPRINP